MLPFRRNLKKKSGLGLKSSRAKMSNTTVLLPLGLLARKRTRKTEKFSKVVAIPPVIRWQLMGRLVSVLRATRERPQTPAMPSSRAVVSTLIVFLKFLLSRAAIQACLYCCHSHWDSCDLHCVFCWMLFENLQTRGQDQTQTS